MNMNTPKTPYSWTLEPDIVKQIEELRENYYKIHGFRLNKTQMVEMLLKVGLEHQSLIPRKI